MLTIEIIEHSNTVANFVIGKPAQEGQDFACALSLNGGPSHPVFGVTPIDALENALTAIKGAAAKVHAPSWRIT